MAGDRTPAEPALRPGAVPSPVPLPSAPMLVESSRFGSFEVDASRSLSFDDSLLGFPDSTTYVVVEVEDTPYVWLQSGDEPDVAFLVTSPFLFFPDYDIELPEQARDALGVNDPSQIEVLALLTVHRMGDAPVAITANLLGPIVVNVESRKAAQVVLDRSGYSTREPLVA
jgi:flagellar assembly factor FliW